MIQGMCWFCCCPDRYLLLLIEQITLRCIHTIHYGHKILFAGNDGMADTDVAALCN